MPNASPGPLFLWLSDRRCPAFCCSNSPAPGSSSRAHDDNDDDDDIEKGEGLDVSASAVVEPDRKQQRLDAGGLRVRKSE
jgi:hypothetical protein